ncbi:MAG: heliorhodopsin HeR [Actinobacteria bacterium]|nr:heliorhodopsin HeR [Actinomycetota bacterium]
MEAPMEPEIIKLRKLNLAAGFLHLASLAAILLLSNDASLPVNATYLTEAPGTGNFSDPINLFNLNIGYMVAAFLALSAFFHFLISSPAIFPRYVSGLKNHINMFRWVEYSLSSSLMIIVILQLNGTADYIALLGIFGVNVCMILFGWLQEKYTTPGDGDLLPFFFGCLAGSIPWIATAINLVSPKGPADATAPGFVYGIVVSLFILFNCFAIVQWKQYKARGKWANYLHGERIYIVLSLVAKSVLAWQVFSGALAS